MIKFAKMFFLIVMLLALSSDFIYSDNSKKTDHALTPLEIVNITPSGEDVPASQQIVFQFNRPVVPVGRMDRDASEIPIDITPEVKGQWRWLNTNNLALMLDEENTLSPATKYTILVNPGIKTEDGTTLKEPVHHTFITERPKVVNAQFNKWETPGAPVLRIIFNQPVTKKSVERHFFINFRVQTENRFNVIAEPDPDYKEIPRILPLPGEPIALITSDQKKEQSKKKNQDSEINAPEARIVWLVSPEKELPLDTPITFNVEPGLESNHGPEKGIENRNLQSLHTLPEFKFVGIRCIGYGQNNRQIDIKSSDDARQCNPGSPVSLLFSSPVFIDEVKDYIDVKPDPPSEINDYNQGYPQSDYLYRVFYNRGYFPVTLFNRLDADKKYKISGESGKIIDAFGRTLKNPVDISFVTGQMDPACSYKRNPVILEKNAETDMFFTVTNLDSLRLRYDRLSAKGIVENLSNPIQLPGIKNKEIAVPANIRKILDQQSGVVKGTVSTTPDLNDRYRYNPLLFVSEVTPFDVHIKLGHFNTLVWVTDMSTGKPVSGAKVKIYWDTYSSFNADPAVITGSTTDSTGIAVLGGNNIIPDPPTRYTENYRNYFDQPKLFMRVEKGDDIALLTLDYDFNINNPDINQSYYRPKVWGTTSQGVYKPGDKIQYKIYVRDMNNETFISPARKIYNLKVIDPKRQTAYEKADCRLSEFGTIHGEFIVPEASPSGWYIFQLSNPAEQKRSQFSNPYSGVPFEPMKVLISDFTPAPFNVTTEINGEVFEPGDEMTVTTKAILHDGGAYGDASARITVMLQSQTPEVFFNLDDRQLSGFKFDTGDSYYMVKPVQVIKQITGSLDGTGKLITKIDIPKNEYSFAELITESAVKDDRGKYISGSKNVKYAATDRYVGIKGDRVFPVGEPATVEFITIDRNGKPVIDIPININVEFEEVITRREKGRGNTTIRKYIKEWKSQEEQEIKSGEEPMSFNFTPENFGNYRITGTIRDAKGREHSSRIHISVYKNARWQSDRDSYSDLKIIPEETVYKVGDTARYRVRNPFPGSKALITVEKYGVLKQWIENFDTEEPVVEFKIDKDFIPGYYLSVVVMTPRTAPQPEYGKEDTGRPDFKVGYIKTEVDDLYKELDIIVNPEKMTYKPGERVKVDLEVSSKHGKKNEPVELAVVVLNEEVLSLISQGKDYFNPYKGFYNSIDLSVQNYNLLSQLISRLNFKVSDSLFVSAFSAGAEADKFALEEARVEEAAAQMAREPQGTLYGRGSTAGSLNIISQQLSGADALLKLRTIFKFVTYWNPSIVTDTSGKVSFEFEAPENLTGWRVLAMAVTPGDQMGLGEGKIAVTRPTEIRPVMPNQVTEGDSFNAGFSIMNRTEKTRELSMTITAEGAISTDPGNKIEQITKTITAEPYKRTTVWLPLKAKGSGKIKLTARGGDSIDKDGVIHELEVRKMASLETAATYGTTVDGAAIEQLRFPDDIRTDVGSVNVNLTPTVIGQVEGAFKYLRDYPYECWEQKITKGVMASHYQNLKEYMPDDFVWEGAEKLTQSMLEGASGFQAPNGGMTYYISENQYVSPYLSAYTGLAFTWLKDRGHEIPSGVQNKLNAYLIEFLQKEENPSFYSAGMGSTVRAVALAALSRQGKLTFDDLKRYYSHIKEMDLFGKAHFLLAATEIPGTEEICKEVFNIILSHANQTGGKFIFSEPFDDGYSRILTSSIRTNAAVLSSLIAYGKSEEGKKLVGDIPFKLVRYITQTRKQSGRWENTQENIFCMNALVEYSKAYETDKPDMNITAKLGDENMGKARFKDVRDAPVVLSRLIQDGDPGRKTEITIKREGEGRLYYSAGLTYAPLKINTEPINAGIDIKREYSVERNGEWVLLQSTMEIKRGELVRVDLFVSLPSARNFVVVDDPVPGGLEPVNSDLATSSQVDADKGAYKPAGGSWWFHYGDWSYYGISRWSFYHRELRHHAARFYSEYLSAGNYHLSYTAQAIAPGEFTVMPAHAEEMYDPDVFGKSGAGILKVKMED